MEMQFQRNNIFKNILSEDSQNLINKNLIYQS